MRKLIIAIPVLSSLLIAGQKNRKFDELYLIQLKTAEAYYRHNQIGEAKKMLLVVPDGKRTFEWHLLNARTDRSVHTIIGHTKSVVGIAVSKDGKLLATGSADNSSLFGTDPAPQPSWVNPPANITISCAQAEVYAAPNLNYTNGATAACLISGTTTPVITRNYTECGGDMTITWSYDVTCWSGSYSQTITVQPAPLPAFVNPPANTTISCDQALTFTVPALNYTNGLAGECLITGSTSPTLDPDFNDCGGTITVTWLQPLLCGGDISYAQTITVNPPPVPFWINPPANTTITCAQADAFVAPDLNYSNAANGVCLITGTASGDVTTNFTECGGTITVTYDATDPCGRAIPTHTQTITVQPAPLPAWVNPPANQTITCDEALSFAPGNADFSNGASGTCEITGSVSGVITNTNFKNFAILYCRCIKFYNPIIISPTLFSVLSPEIFDRDHLPQIYPPSDVCKISLALS